MPARMMSKPKKPRIQRMKLPNGAATIKKSAICLHAKNEMISKEAEEICDAMMASEWAPATCHPHQGMRGFYVICRWYGKERTWVILYLGSGIISKNLQVHFSGKERTPIGIYLSSFPKAVRNLLWVKWIKEPLEDVILEDLLPVLAEKYNGGNQLCFNSVVDMTIEDDTVPDDFSIVPEFLKEKKKSKKPKKPKA